MRTTEQNLEPLLRAITEIITYFYQIGGAVATPSEHLKCGILLKI